jgi:copper chaperone
MSKVLSAVLLAVVVLGIGGWLVFRYMAPGKEAPAQASETSARQFAVEGMSCQGCVDSVTGAIEKLPGVRSAKVSLAEKKAVVVADPAQVPDERIEAAIAAAGYQGHPIAGTPAK